MIKILIADDHILIREGFKKIIDREIDLSVVGEAQNSREVLEFVKQKECDVIVLDISMPGRSGLDVLKELKAINPRINVLILSMHPEERFAIRALKAGASGYITKESAPAELVKAIRKVADGRKYVSETVAEDLTSALVSDKGRALHESLSDREFQVLRLIGLGKTVHDIADELSLSPSTINTYRARILDKMNMRSNVELIHYVIQNKLID
ncbi:response regulator transcription factor [candidate division KSB1 bacterium]|nr:response regulator transcription factor [candidate division KSB1 bacterium]